jgi:hypothetical protein
MQKKQVFEMKPLENGIRLTVKGVRSPTAFWKKLPSRCLIMPRLPGGKQEGFKGLILYRVLIG